MTSPIQAHGLGRRFGDVAVVDDLDIDVARGTIQGIIGPSGSGKTTTVRMLTGVLAPSAGRAQVLGRDPQLLTTEERQRIGYMPQLGVLYPHLTIADNLRFAAALYGLRRPGGRIDEVLAMLDLGGTADRALRDASGGMQRRVALAAALLHHPEVLFLDEPTSGLDPVLRQKLWDHLADLRDEGRTLLVTTQIVSEAAKCDRVGLIADGGMLAEGSPVELRRRADGGDVLDVHTADRLPDAVVDDLAAQPFVQQVRRIGTEGRSLRVVVDDAESDTSAVSGWLRNAGAEVTLTERFLADFDDVFVALLERRS